MSDKPDDAGGRSKKPSLSELASFSTMPPPAEDVHNASTALGPVPQALLEQLKQIANATPVRPNITTEAAPPPSISEQPSYPDSAPATSSPGASTPQSLPPEFPSTPPSKPPSMPPREVQGAAGIASPSATPLLPPPAALDKAPSLAPSNSASPAAPAKEDEKRASKSRTLFMLLVILVLTAAGVASLRYGDWIRAKLRQVSAEG